MIRIALAALTSAAIAIPASAHDFWIEPADFTPDAAGTVEVDVFVGHGEDKTGWPVAPHRIIGLRCLGPLRDVREVTCHATCRRTEPGRY